MLTSLNSGRERGSSTGRQALRIISAASSLAPSHTAANVPVHDTREAGCNPHQAKDYLHVNPLNRSLSHETRLNASTMLFQPDIK